MLPAGNCLPDGNIPADRMDFHGGQGACFVRPAVVNIPTAAGQGIAGPEGFRQPQIYIPAGGMQRNICGPVIIQGDFQVSADGGSTDFIRTAGETEISAGASGIQPASQSVKGQVPADGRKLQLIRGSAAADIPAGCRQIRQMKFISRDDFS